jgi:hypothetical protein
MYLQHQNPHNRSRTRFSEKVPCKPPDFDVSSPYIDSAHDSPHQDPVDAVVARAADHDIKPLTKTSDHHHLISPKPPHIDTQQNLHLIHNANPFYPRGLNPHALMFVPCFDAGNGISEDIAFWDLFMVNLRVTDFGEGLFACGC